MIIEYNNLWGREQIKRLDEFSGYMLSYILKMDVVFGSEIVIDHKCSWDNLDHYNHDKMDLAFVLPHAVQTRGLSV
jgi:hypothetical protein